MKSITLLALSGLLTGLSTFTQAANLSELKLPNGFAIEVFADNIPDARTLRLGAKGTVFVSTRKEGAVYALRNGRRYTLAEGLKMPNGIDFRDGALYVAEMDRILRFDQIEDSLDRPPMPQVVRADLPDKTHHGWRYIGFGPDGKLYVALGAPCNTCVGEAFQRKDSKLEFASITRMNPDGSDWEVVARGVRNSVGFDFHPATGELWFTDNGSDWIGDDLPNCELNRLRRAGQHFGYPYCHQGDVPDPEFGKGRRCADFEPPQALLGAHVAPLGMRFYTGTMFPEKYRRQIFVAKHGSWNRSRKSGYTVDLVRLDERGQVLGTEPFIQGWLKQGFLGVEQVSGRPVDVLVMPDGALLVSDDHAGRVYRVSYKP
jgi:glucose/arabinose dehydrogenase